MSTRRSGILSRRSSCNVSSQHAELRERGAMPARARLGCLQAIIINSGNANAYTGQHGLAMAQRMCAMTAAYLKIAEGLVIPSSTGRIGVALPRRKIEAGVRAACRHLSRDGFHE